MKFDDGNGARKCMLNGVVGEVVYFVLPSADRINAQSTVRDAAVVCLFPPSPMRGTHILQQLPIILF